MRIEQFRYLLAVNEYRSINKAAKALHITQPSLGAALTAFEEEVGFHVFSRTRQGVFPTAKGKRLLQDLDGILLTIDGWDQMVDIPDSTNSLEDEVRISVIRTLSNSVMVDVMLSLHDRYPNLSVILKSDRNAGVFTAMENQSANLYLGCVKSPDLSFLQEYHMQGEILGSDNMMVFLSSENPLATKESLMLEDLIHLDYVGYEDPGKQFPYPELFSSILQHQVFSLSSRNQILHIVARDKGFTLFNKIAAVNEHYVTTGAITALPIANRHMPLYYFIAYPQKHRLSLAERVTYNAIVEEFRRLEPFLK